jgi:hypothetical protein
MKEIIDRLIELSGAGEPHDGTETYIFRPSARAAGAKAYLSGVPYLWSNFAERAFIFRDRAQAEELLREFPIALCGCTVAAFNSTPASGEAVR